MAANASFLGGCNRLEDTMNIAPKIHLSVLFFLGVGLSTHSMAAGGQENPAPRLSELSEAECEKIGHQPVEVCVAWKSASASVVRKAHCAEKRPFCAPPEN